MKVLVIAAHPDDEVLGCGGTMIKLAPQNDVHIAILGEGMTSRSAARDGANPASVTALHEDARAVSALLGARSLSLIGLPDNRFDQLPLLDVVKKVEQIISELEPTVIYTHHPGDLNIDHLVTFRAVLTATRPLENTSVRDIYAFEVSSSTEWAFNHLEPVFKPNVFVDIGTSLPGKLAAMARYQSEARSFPHPRSAEAITAQARRWGATCGLPSAEAFQLIRSIRSDT